MENEEKIYSIVKNHFSLSEKSLGIFKELLDNPVIDDVYKSFGLNENGRKYWELDESISEEIDRGWIAFKTYFKTFYETFNMTYENFRNNKIVDERKNTVKLKKAMLNYYVNNKEDLGGSILSHVSGRLEYFEELLEIGNNSRLRNSFRMSYEEAQDAIECKLKGNSVAESYKKTLDKILTNELERIGVSKLPNRKLYLVLSCNFADWFFCSSGERWESCLGLESHYFYWAGLPGLITDTNRAMLYVTDLSKKHPITIKDEYKSIELDKIISRSWLLLSPENKINTVRFYPSQILGLESIKKIMGYENIEEIEDSYANRSKNAFKLLYYTNGIANTIYYDETCLVRSDGKNNGEDTLFRHSFHNGSGTCSYDIGSGDIINSEDVVGGFCSGLSEIIIDNRTLAEGFCDVDSEICASCDYHISGEVFYVNEECYCEECFSDIFTYCSSCGEIIQIDFASFVEGDNGFYCDDCFENNFTTCEDCGETYPNSKIEHIHSLSANICINCLQSNYVECSICGGFVKTEDDNEINGKHYCEDCVPCSEEKIAE